MTTYQCPICGGIDTVQRKCPRCGVSTERVDVDKLIPRQTTDDLMAENARQMFATVGKVMEER